MGRRKKKKSDIPPPCHRLALLTQAFRKPVHTSETRFPNSPVIGGNRCSKNAAGPNAAQKKPQNYAVATAIQINHPQAIRPHLTQEGPTLKPFTHLDHRSLELEPSLELHPQPLPTCLWDELLYECIHCRPWKKSKKAESGTVQSNKLRTQNSNTIRSP